MTFTPSLPKYSINPPPTEEELKKAEEILKIAKKELEKELKNRIPKTKKEIIKEFEEIRQNIIKQCEENRTLNDID